jgi:hypothetical protein
MERRAVSVDAGWFLAEAAQALTGRGSRGAIDCDCTELRTGFWDHVMRPGGADYFRDIRGVKVDD